MFLSTQRKALNIDLHCPSPHFHSKGIKMNIHKNLNNFQIIPGLY